MSSILVVLSQLHLADSVMVLVFHGAKVLLQKFDRIFKAV